MVATDPAYGGQGIGNKVTTFCGQLAKKKNCQGSYSQVWFMQIYASSLQLTAYFSQQMCKKLGWSALGEVMLSDVIDEEGKQIIVVDDWTCHWNVISVMICFVIIAGYLSLNDFCRVFLCWNKASHANNYYSPLNLFRAVAIYPLSGHKTRLKFWFILEIKHPNKQ